VQFRPRAHRQVGIELSPLIDVVFQLLIFFAVTTTFLQVSGLELELPEAEGQDAERSAAGSAESDLLVIELAADGAIMFRGEPTTLESLHDLLRAALQGRARRDVILRADREARHGQVVGVMDVVRRAGARGLSIATRPPERGPGAPAERSGARPR